MLTAAKKRRTPAEGTGSGARGASDGAAQEAASVADEKAGGRAPVATGGSLRSSVLAGASAHHYSLVWAIHTKTPDPTGVTLATWRPPERASYTRGTEGTFCVLRASFRAPSRHTRHHTQPDGLERFISHKIVRPTSNFDVLRRKLPRAYATDPTHRNNASRRYILYGRRAPKAPGALWQERQR